MIKPIIGKGHIITHRGLEPSRKNFYSESSLEAFASQLSRGFGGIEFDPNVTSDGIIVMHDATLARLTGGKDSRPVSEISTSEVTNIPLSKGTIPTFEQVLELVKKSRGSINSLHLKAGFQTTKMLAKIIETLASYKEIFPKLLVFDVKPSTAHVLKNEFPTLRLACSVAHPYDIKRYGALIGDTLFTIDQALKLRSEGLIEGVWADEWDKIGPRGSKKIFYTKENFDQLHIAGLFISVAAPELHGTSPGLYGGESHEDARDIETLFTRIKQIKEAGADYFCTDYPEEVAKL